MATADPATVRHCHRRGGHAGCVLAGERGRPGVLLLERRNDTYPWILPVGHLYCMNNPRAEVRCGPTPSQFSGPRPHLSARQVLAAAPPWHDLHARPGGDYVMAAVPAGAGRRPPFPPVGGQFPQGERPPRRRRQWTIARQRLHWNILEAFRDAAEEIGTAPGRLQRRQRSGFRGEPAGGILDGGEGLSARRGRRTSTCHRRALGDPARPTEGDRRPHVADGARTAARPVFRRRRLNEKLRARHRPGCWPASPSATPSRASAVGPPRSAPSSASPAPANQLASRLAKAMALECAPPDRASP